MSMSFARNCSRYANVRLRAVVATYGFLDLGHTREYLKNPKMTQWVKSLLLDAAR